MGILTCLIRKVLLKKGYYLIKHHDAVEDAIAYNTEKNITKFYNNPKSVAAYIKNVAEPHAKLMVAFLKKANINLTNKTLADIGCGTGHFLNEIIALSPTINAIGYEINKAPLNTAKLLFPHINFEVHGVYDELPQKFDIICINHVLEHLPYPEDCIMAMARGLNLNGILILNVPNGRLDSFGGHIHFFSKDSLELLIKRHISYKALNSMLNEDGTLMCTIVSM
jgi:2-polyprenyl-3-methyl-5-hydroxy-6-metoxy-1,4-benzoquinol methylase